jgi:hypothetical protein
MRRPHNEQSVPRAPEAAGAVPSPLGVQEIADVASFYADMQASRIQAGASPATVQAASRSRREFTESAAILGNLAADPNITDADSAATELNRRIEKLPEEIKDETVRFEEQARLIHAGNCITNYRNNHGMMETPVFKEWKQRRDARQTAIDERYRQAGQTGEARARAEAVDASRTAVAEAGQEGLIQAVLKGGVSVYTDLGGNLSDTNIQGFTNRSDPRLLEKPNGSTIDDFSLAPPRHHFREETYGDRGIYEGVIFKPATRNIFEAPPPEKKKLWGSQPAPKPARIVGTEQVTMAEMMEGGSDEPAVTMVYRTFNDSAITREETLYMVAGSRPGNILALSICMPESVAKELEGAARQDPRIVRTIVEKAMLENLGITEGMWRDGADRTGGHPIRPPYEGWANANGGVSRMYFKDPDSREFDADQVAEFRA